MKIRDLSIAQLDQEAEGTNPYDVSLLQRPDVS
jgi:hypothetical protein